jgi:hypothetical protein
MAVCADGPLSEDGAATELRLYGCECVYRISGPAGVLVYCLALRSDVCARRRLVITGLGMLATLWPTTWLFRSGRSVCWCSSLRKAACGGLEQQSVGVRIATAWVCSWGPAMSHATCWHA